MRRYWIFSFLATFVATSAFAADRNGWTCAAEPMIYPGWWVQSMQNLQKPGTPETIDGTRVAAPVVVKLRENGVEKYFLYYLAEARDPSSPMKWVGRTRILRTETTPDRPSVVTPKNVVMDYQGQWNPKNGNYSTGFHYASPYAVSILPALDENLEPRRKRDGSFEPWLLYHYVWGSNIAIAESLDAGRTFKLREDVSPLFPFEVYRDPQNPNEWRRGPIQSKLFDRDAQGSGTVIRAPNGKYILFYTARLWNNHTLDDIGATKEQVGHPEGQIPDYGIGYAESDTPLGSFRRRTAVSLGVTSSAAQGARIVGRIIEPRFHLAPHGQMEYVVSRPMVSEDGTDVAGKTLYRMTVSSHSKTYRVRSLHSTDLINWTWDDSPAEGMFGFGAPGSFDDSATTYAHCIRDRGERRCWYTGNQYGHINAPKTGIGYCAQPAN